MSFAELLVVLVIIAATSVAALSAYPQFLCGDDVQSVSKQLCSDLQKARQAAMTLSFKGVEKDTTGAGVRFESGTAYRLFSFIDGNFNAHCDGPEEEQSLSGERDPAQRSFSSAVLKIYNNGVLKEPLDAAVWFDHKGFPQTSERDFAKLSIVVQAPKANQESRCVTVHLGRIREGRWESERCIEE